MYRSRVRRVVKRPQILPIIEAPKAEEKKLEEEVQVPSAIADTQPGPIEVESQQFSQPVVVVWGRLYSKKTEIMSLGKRQKIIKKSITSLNDYIGIYKMLN